MIQKILIKATDICLIFFLLWFVWYEVSYYNICLPIINMRFDSILGKLVFFFPERWKKTLKIKKTLVYWMSIFGWFAMMLKEENNTCCFQDFKKKKIMFVWYLYVILNYRMNHSCKVYYYFNSLINWRHIINKFKY